MNKNEYYKKYQGCCGTCHYWTEEDNGCSCMCLDSPFAADWTDAEDDCDCYIERRMRA